MIDGAGTNHFVTLMIFMNYSCILKIGMSHTKVHISPRGGGRVMPYMLYRYMYEPLWRFIWFSSSLFWDRVYKSESLGLELWAITNVNSFKAHIKTYLFKTLYWWAILYSVLTCMHIYSFYFLFFNALSFICFF